MRQKPIEEAIVAANKIIVAQAEQISAQAEQIEALMKSVALLTTKIEGLQAENTKLKSTSKNSNKPPSSDGYRKPTVKNQRVRSGLKEVTEKPTLFH